MKVLVDTNVVLDVLLRRVPFYTDSRAVYELVERRVCTGCVSSSAMTDIFYLARKELKNHGLVYRLMDILCADFATGAVIQGSPADFLTLLS